MGTREHLIILYSFLYSFVKAMTTKQLSKTIILNSARCVILVVASARAGVYTGCNFLLL
uniref:Uncharacterized protein n=1 Tax=Rhizophora mucronata TaxID=61149 RepID=A0A2P2LKW8_RHIMU